MILNSQLSFHHYLLSGFTWVRFSAPNTDNHLFALNSAFCEYAFRFQTKVNRTLQHLIFTYLHNYGYTDIASIGDERRFCMVSERRPL
jgi:hypothetical protein